MVVLVPEPEIPDNPITVGVDEIVQVPVGGKLLNTTLPVVEEHVTSVMVSTVGAVGEILNVITTSSVLAVQGLFEIVHRKV